MEESQAIHKFTYDSIMKYDVDIRRDWYTNTVLRQKTVFGKEYKKWNIKHYIYLVILQHIPVVLKISGMLIWQLKLLKIGDYLVTAQAITTKVNVIKEGSKVLQFLKPPTDDKDDDASQDIHVQDAYSYDAVVVAGIYSTYVE